MESSTEERKVRRKVVNLQHSKIRILQPSPQRRKSDQRKVIKNL
jgi:hypothetical protein